MKESCPSEMLLHLKLVMKLTPERYFCQRGHKMDLEDP